MSSKKSTLTFQLGKRLASSLSKELLIDPSRLAYLQMQLQAGLTTAYNAGELEGLEKARDFMKKEKEKI